MAARETVRTILEGAVLAVLGFVAIQVFQLNGDLGELRGVSKGTSERLDRIAGALPDIRVQIAQEELKKSVVMAMVAEKPVKTSGGTWKASVHMVDGDRKKRAIYSKEASGPEDESLSLIAQAIIKQHAANSFDVPQVQELQRTAGEAEVAVQCPFCGDVDNGSLIVYSAKPSELKVIFFELEKYASPEGLSVATSFSATKLTDLQETLDQLQAEIGKKHGPG